MIDPLINSLVGGVAIAVAATLLRTDGAHAQVRCATDGISWHCIDFGPAPVYSNR